MPDRTLTVHIVGDDESLRRAFARSEKSTKQFQGQMTSVAKTARTAFAAAGVTIGSAVAVDLIRQSVTAASDLNEEITKSEQIFGESSESVRAWSRDTARSLGISQTAALQATGIFGNLFRVVDVAPEKSAEMSRALVQLAADLASFNNANPEEVLQAIRSGLIGEAEPLRRYGVLLSETRVQQEAMAATGKNNVKELTNQEKALARYQIILQDTAPAQGDFARTSEGLANQSRILKAQMSDLSANIGSLLLPALTDAAEAANLLFAALDQMRGVDFTPGFDFPEPPSWLRSLAIAPISPLGAAALSIKRALEDSAKDIEEATRPDDLAGPRGPGAVAAENVRKAAEERERELKEMARSLEQSRKRFSSFTRGLGLKLDKAAITDSFDDDIAVLQELERAIQRQIRREGKTFKLVEALTEVRAQLSGLVGQRAEEQAQRSRDAFQQVFDALDLKLERARGTERLDDDLRVLEKIENAIRKRIAAEGRTLELERQLLDVRRQQAEVRREQAEQLRAQREKDQFRALGLTETGEERTPSTGSLRKRLGGLREAVQGTALDTDKTERQLDRIAKVLSGKFGKVGKDVRAAILQMFDDIASALKDGDKQTNASGEITRGGIKSLKQLTEGLGLTQEQLEEMGRRQMGVDRRDRRSAFGFSVDGPKSSTSGGGREPEITLHNHIVIDGKDVATSVNRVNQKNGRRRSSSRSGRAGGRPAGI